MDKPLRILHVMRAPVGGLFRHVADLARAQMHAGHAVGIVADSTSGSAQANQMLAELSSTLALGVKRIAMSRHVGPGDVSAVREVAAFARASEADVVHGHGAKGGAFARLASLPDTTLRVYTPHGGSLHFDRTNPVGLVYLGLESLLLARTDLLLFESAYARDTFARKVGAPAPERLRVIHNGVAMAEFEPVPPANTASDFVYVGELRHLKGVDVLIEALAGMDEPMTATIVGDGPDRAIFEQLVKLRGLSARVAFTGALPARKAFAMGHVLAVPSRAESLPYVVLEAAAAGLPVVATSVGGIPEIFGAQAQELVPPGDAIALRAALLRARAQARGSALTERVRAGFSLPVMAAQVLDAYGQARQARIRAAA
jgi:glycosyltransferase involved in cell wall biosynthesis